MVKRRGAESLEPELGGPPLLHEIGGQTADEIPSLCVALRRARMNAGYEVKDVSTALRIRSPYLEALEEGRFDDLPGMTYAIGFLRSYCEFLGLDPKEMIDRFKSETASGIEPRDLTFPTPPREGGKPKPWLILVVLLLAGLVYGGWRVYSTEGRIATDLVSDVSTKLTAAAGLSEDEALREAVFAEGRAGEESSAAQSALSRPLIAEEKARTAAARSGEVAPEATLERDGAGLRPEKQSASGAPSETDSARIESAETAPGRAAGGAENLGAAADVRSADDVAAANARPETEAPAAVDASRRSNSLWDGTGENQPSEPPAVSAAAVSETGEALPMIRNASARDLDGGAISEEINVASASPETTDAPAYAANIYGVENTDFRIAIKATADSWVQIQGPDNELLLTRILRTGEVYRVPDRSGLLMVTGNAGALEVRVDGALVEPLGPIGVVRRNVALDPEILAAGSEARR